MQHYFLELSVKKVLKSMLYPPPEGTGIRCTKTS